MNKAKRMKHIRQHTPTQVYSICRNCGELGAHYIPAFFGEQGFYYCDKKK